MLNRISESLRRFMYGRYGMDQLTLALLILGMASSLISSAFRRSSFLFDLIYMACVIVCFYRMLSRDCSKRIAENQRFMMFWNSLTVRFRGVKGEMEQRKVYSLFKCPQCGQKLRLPKGKGLVEVTCTQCKTKFQKKT
ncbi:MAG: hypothetical protein RSD07_09480 [Angelakisella sp.]